MKTTCEDSPKSQLGYPKLMICDIDSSDRGMVVLMRAYGKGVVLHSPGPCDKGVGHTSDSWCMGCFTDFNGVVKLEN